MSLLQFEEVTRPGTDDGTDIGSDDLTCEVCGTPLSYSGKGRKPKYCDEHKRSSSSSSTRSRSAGADVELAVNSLHTLYTSLVFPLSAVSPAAAHEWDAQIKGLDERNRAYLSTNKDLVKKINSAAAKGGSTAFVLSHLLALGPVGMILWTEHNIRRANREAQTYAEEATQADASVNPDMAFMQ